MSKNPKSLLAKWNLAVQAAFPHLYAAANRPGRVVVKGKNGTHLGNNSFVTYDGRLVSRKLTPAKNLTKTYKRISSHGARELSKGILMKDPQYAKDSTKAAAALVAEVIRARFSKNHPLAELSVQELVDLFSVISPALISGSLSRIKNHDRDLKEWENYVIKRLKHPKREVNIAVVGKYIQLPDAYKSIYEALVHGGIANDAKVNIVKIDSEDLEKGKPDKYFKDIHGILVPGGFGSRGIEGKVRAVKFAREKNIPFFGICLGMQLATVEFARTVCGLKTANSTEFDKATKDPVISLLAEQHQVTNMGATMRLGAYSCRLEKDTRA
jgi:CTP synthase (UTP-ammonia lyase)